MWNGLLNYRNYGRLWRVYGRSVVRYGSARKYANALRTEWAYRRRRVDVASRPFVLFVEPLYYCNLDCPLCPRQNFPGARQDKEGRKLPLEVFDHLLDEIGDHLFQCQIFGNGEPLLDWPRTAEIVRKAHARGIFTLVNTNATLVTEPMAEEIVASGCDYLICAIDGVTQDAYAAYRVGGKVEDALRGLRRVADARRRLGSRIDIEWQFLVSRFTQHQMDDARRMADEMGVFLRFAPMGGMDDNPALKQHWLPREAPGLSRGFFDGQPSHDYACYWLWRSLFLNANGTLGRCPGYANVAELGSIVGRPVMDVYNGPSSQQSRRLFRDEPYPGDDYPAPCGTCSFFERHHGGPNRAWRPESAPEPARGPLVSLGVARRVGAPSPEPVMSEG